MSVLVCSMPKSWLATNLLFWYRKYGIINIFSICACSQYVSVQYGRSGKQPLRFNINRSTLACLYKSLIRPIMEYGDIIWDNCTVESAKVVSGEKACIPKRALLWPRDNPVDVTSMIFLFFLLPLSIRICVSEKLWPMNKVIMSISPDSDCTISVEVSGNWLACTNATSFVSASSWSLVNSANVATSSWLILLHTDLLEKYTTFAFWPDTTVHWRRQGQHWWQSCSPLGLHSWNWPSASVLPLS